MLPLKADGLYKFLEMSNIFIFFQSDGCTWLQSAYLLTSLDICIYCVYGRQLMFFFYNLFFIAFSYTIIIHQYIHFDKMNILRKYKVYIREIDVREDRVRNRVRLLECDMMCWRFCGFFF